MTLNCISWCVQFSSDCISCALPLGGVEPSSPNHPTFEDETDVLLGNDGDVPAEDEEEGEELFGDNFERWVLPPKPITFVLWHTPSGTLYIFIIILCQLYFTLFAYS